MTIGSHISGYSILTNEDPKELGKLVEATIHEGWQPLGTLCVSSRGDGFRAMFAQAMVKYADRF